MSTWIHPVHKMRIEASLWLLIVASLAARRGICQLQTAASVHSHSIVHSDGAVVESTLSFDATPVNQGRQHEGPFLVIGVKSTAARNAAVRQAMRHTWARPEILDDYGVKLLFLGCEPDLTMLPEDVRSQTEQAIVREKQTYGDFLTHELGCKDSFFTLVDKTVAFFALASARFPSLSYAMVIDDDVFVRVDKLVALLKSDAVPDLSFYAGDPTKYIQHPSSPIRRPDNRYYLSPEVYPLSQLPPFVAGAQYVVSSDIVHFIARNRYDLKGLRGLDDATMGLWMLALQVHPRQIHQFQILREHNCTEDLIAYADLSPQAMHHIHDNLHHGRPFCDGFEYTKWMKEYRTITFPDHGGGTQPNGEDGSGEKNDVKFHWELQLDNRTQRFTVLCILFVGNESVSIVYDPSSGSYLEEFCDRMVPAIEAKLSILVGRKFCVFHRKELLGFMVGITAPAMRALKALANHNLQRANAFDENYGVVTTGVYRVAVITSQLQRHLRVIMENLLIATQHDKQVVLVDHDALSKHQQIDAAIVDASTLASTIKMNSSIPIIAIHSEPAPLPRDDRISVVFTDSVSTLGHSIHLPQVSSIFGGIVKHAPSELLRSAEAVTANRVICVARGTRCDSHPHHQAIEQLITKTDSLTACTDAKAAALRPSLMPIDDEIERLRGCKFVIVDESDLPIPRSTGEGVVTAFLAGAVPVHLGVLGALVALLNPEALVDCGRLNTVSECVDTVVPMTASVADARYEAMRKQPPIVDRRAFVEVFSWHPAVVDMVTPGSDEEGLVMSSRFKTLLAR